MKIKKERERRGEEYPVAHDLIWNEVSVNVMSLVVVQFKPVKSTDPRKSPPWLEEGIADPLLLNGPPFRGSVSSLGR